MTHRSAAPHGLARALASIVSVLGLLVLGAPSAAADEAQYLAISLAAADPSSLYTAVIVDDPTSDDSTYLVMEQDARTGAVGQQVADLGTTPIEAIEAAEGLVLVADGTGTIHVYGRSGGGYRTVATWPVTVPGYAGDVFVGGMTVLPGGTVAATVTVQADDEPYYDPPVFAGVVLLDPSGGVIDQWAVDVRIDEPNAFVLPTGIDSLPSGEIFVGGIPCQAGLCGPQVVDEGWAFELDVRRGAADRTLVLREQWSDPLLQNATSVVALDREHLVVSSPDDGAVEVALGDSSVERVAVVAASVEWGVEGIAASRAPRSTVYVLEGDVGSDKRVRVLRRTSGDWTLLASYPANWTADEAAAALR